MDVALITDADPAPRSDDALLLAELKRLGVVAAAVSWCDPDVDWSEPRLCLVRTRLDSAEGRDWLDRLPAGVRVENALALWAHAADIAPEREAGVSLSLVYIDGIFTHAVAGDDPALVATPTASLLVADRVMDQAGRPMFARVDLVERGGEIEVGRVELGAGDLYLRLSPVACSRLARGAVLRLRRAGWRDSADPQRAT